jgi:hypothetical protein
MERSPGKMFYNGPFAQYALQAALQTGALT